MVGRVQSYHDEGYDEDATGHAFSKNIGHPRAEAVDVQDMGMHEREDLVYQLLAVMPRSQVAKIHRRITPALQFDIVGMLPTELSLLIFSHLSWQVVLRCELVSKRWSLLANDQSVWKNLCHKRGWFWKQPPYEPLVDCDVPSHSRNPHFHDEGMGEDEDSDEGQTLTYYQQESGYVTQSLTTPDVFEFIGLPSTPRQGRRPLQSIRRRDRSRSRSLLRLSRKKSAPNFSRPLNAGHQPSAMDPDYKLLHRTYIRLFHRFMNGSYHIRTLDTATMANSHTSIIYCLQLYTYEDGRQVLFTGSKDKTIREWDLMTGKVERVFEGAHEASVLSICIKGKYVVSGGSDWRVCVWDIETGELVKVIRDHQDSVLCVRFDEKRLVSCSKDRTVRVYLFPELEQYKVLEAHRIAVNAVALSDDYIVSASGDKSLCLWDATTGALLRTFEDFHARGIASIDFQPPYILSGSSDSHIRLYDISTSRGWSTCPHFHNPPPLSGPSICQECGGSISLHHDNDHNGMMIAPSRRASWIRDMHTELVRSVALGTDFAVSGSYDHSVKLWDRKSGSLIADLSGGHEGRVFCVGFDHTKIVSCGEDQRICIWDFSHGLDTSFVCL